VDLSAKMIELARAEEEREPLGIRYEVASMSDLSVFAGATFDAVVSTMALMDCADYAGSIKEFWRVLRPGGLLAFSFCHPCFTYSIRNWDYNEDGEAVGVRLGDYFAENIDEQRWKFGAAMDVEEVEPFTVLYFNRTLSNFINPLCDSGFHLEALHEPRPTEEACRIRPRLRQHRLIPQTLCVKAHKAAQ
ncbi:MAG: class I SAM-dependent methyltransferase, partial [Armatimonadetes bacterium]|nr:class I SAM-dependent methyltransferase [Armatimonadota bacterium]